MGMALVKSSDISGTPRAYSRIVLSPGENTVRFVCDAPKAEAPGDPRTMVLRLDDFRMEKTQYAKDPPSENTSRFAPSGSLGGLGFTGLKVVGIRTGAGASLAANWYSLMTPKRPFTL